MMMWSERVAWGRLGVRKRSAEAAPVACDHAAFDGPPELLYDQWPPASPPICTDATETSVRRPLMAT